MWLKSLKISSHSLKHVEDDHLAYLFEVIKYCCLYLPSIFSPHVWSNSVMCPSTAIIALTNDKILWILWHNVLSVTPGKHCSLYFHPWNASRGSNAAAVPLLLVLCGPKCTCIEEGRIMHLRLCLCRSGGVGQYWYIISYCKSVEQFFRLLLNMLQWNHLYSREYRKWLQEAAWAPSKI